MKYPIIDLHCDLLAYLEEVKSATPFDKRVRCSIPQLEKGGIDTQVCAIFCETKKHSSIAGLRQFSLFEQLPKSSVTFLPAIENMSALLEEDEPIALLEKRLKTIPQPVYISLTWNFENRFGGGNETSIGLKEDGKIVLQLLHGEKIALDLSHTSDVLAHDALSYIDTHSLDIPIIASHSNARKICNVPRNLPDELIAEIVARKGVLGINGIAYFLGPHNGSFIKHIEHILTLKGDDALALGADFFGGISLPSLSHLGTLFFEEFSNASDYPKRIALLESHFGKNFTEKVANRNVEHFLKRNGLITKEGIPL